MRLCSSTYLMVLPVLRRTHCGIGRFCFCALASFCFVLKVLWDYSLTLVSSAWSMSCDGNKVRTGILTAVEDVFFV